MNRLGSLFLGTTSLLLALAAPSARADFHFMKVVEFFPGSVDAPNAQYVMLQMYIGGQTNLNTHGITLYDAAGAVIDSALFTGPVGNGAAQATVLIATPDANTYFSVTADLTSSFGLPLAGGAICFDAIPMDCVAWGAFTGTIPQGAVGTPFAQATGLRLDEAVRRDLGNGVLEANDDTDNSAADFDPASPAPRNNAGVVGTVPPLFEDGFEG